MDLLLYLISWECEGEYNMLHPVLWAILIIIMAIGGWQLVVWLGEIRDKNRKYRAALACARQNDKPLLVGGSLGTKRIRQLLKMPAHGGGDVCLDIDRRAIKGHPFAVIASITDIPFTDKCFGAVFISHVLEHLPTIKDAQKAAAELDRIADSVFLVYPSRQSIAAWVIPDHHLWVQQKDNTTHFQQRGKSVN